MRTNQIEPHGPGPDMPDLAAMVGTGDVDPQDVLVVGEYTTDSGPYGDDYFLVVILRSERSVELPMRRADHVLAELERLTGSPMRPGLADRTDFASRVMHPTALLDRPLYEFRTDAEGPGVLRRIRSLFIPTVRSTLTEEVARYVEVRQRPTGG